MKKILFILVILTPFLAIAQKGDRGEKLKAYKTAFITEVLDLTSAEAEKFWPVYNAHEDKMMELRKSERSEIFQIVRGDLDGLSEADANALLDKAINFKSKELDYEKELVANLKGVISSKKILKLKKAEEEFKRMLLDKFRGRGKRP